MKRSLFQTSLLIIIIWCTFQFLGAQDLGEIVIGNGMFAASFTKDPSDFSGIKNFVERNLASSGTAYSESGNANFLIHTTIDNLYQKDIDVNGVPLIAAHVNFTFTIMLQDGSLNFGNLNLAVKESGENQKVLLRYATRDLKTMESEFKLFLKAARQKIHEYYTEHCNQIIQNAEYELKKEDFDKCIWLLGQVPKEVECYKVASDMILKAFNSKLQKQCDIILKEIDVLIQKKDFSSAYEKIMIIPQNTVCRNNIDKVLDAMDQAVCEKYLSAAESFFSINNFTKCIDLLSGLEKVSKNCEVRKKSLETKIRTILDAQAKKQWEFKIQKYKDNLTKDIEKSKTDHEFIMKKIETDASVRSKELDISVDLEKYKTQREIEFSKNNAIVEKVRLKEVGKTYRSYFNMMGTVIQNSQKMHRY